MGNRSSDTIGDLNFLWNCGLKRYLESLGLKDYQVRIIMDYKLKEEAEE